jgi:hypothetical protein
MDSSVGEIGTPMFILIKYVSGGSHFNVVHSEIQVPVHYLLILEISLRKWRTICYLLFSVRISYVGPSCCTRVLCVHGLHRHHNRPCVTRPLHPPSPFPPYLPQLYPVSLLFRPRIYATATC